MPVSVKFFQFSKKNNSTAQPTTDGTEYQCLFKEPTSLMNPVITLKHENPVGYNYAYISTFGRYYFVTNWKYERGLWYAALNVDVLASWKKEIGNSTQYVLRAASDFDETIIDTFYPCFAGSALYANNIDNPYPATFNDGWFVVGIINGDINAVGAVSYYVFSKDQFDTFKNYLLGDGTWLTLDVSDISANLQKELVNPISYITSCTWIPFKPAVDSMSSTTLPFGWWFLKNQSFDRLKPNINITRVFSFDIPQHPQKNSRGAFLQRTSTYSDFSLFFPPFGTIYIPAETLTGSSTLYVKIIIDAITGVAHAIISPFSEFTSIIAQTSAMLGISVQLSQINNQPLSAMSSVLGGVSGIQSGAMTAASGILTGNPVMALAGASNIQSSIAGAAIGTAQALSPSLQSMGTVGTLAALQFTPELRAKFRLLVDENIQHNGRPYCKTVTLNTLTGFIKCLNSEIQTIATESENSIINNFLNGGFYYEQ